MNARHTPLVAATWLIGLGLVFLVQRAAGWTWSEAWPLFVILVGAGGMAGTLAGDRRSTRGVQVLWALTWPVTWIVAGGALLAATSGQLPVSALDLLDRWWPLAALVLGVWFLVGAAVPVPDVAVERLALDLGARSHAQVGIRFGAGSLRIGSAAPGHLLDGSYLGGVICVERTPGVIQVTQDLDRNLPWLDDHADWKVGLTDAIPLDLRLDTGACRSDLDLSPLRLRSVELHTGASQTRVRAPLAAGLTDMRIEAGAAEVIVEVPAGVAARIRGGVAIGALAIDERRFPKAVDGSFVSPDYATAANRLDLQIQGGLGAVKVIGSEPMSLAA
ncbi:MAG TPA: hypothetical protein VFI34_03620 [Candidatus Limnocylindrales bacterium]|nr:hypothetical protein [Candidatus Limnocylindrales bacterium]